MWVHTPGAGFHAPALGSPTVKSIADFTQGFEAGACALAEKLNTVIGDGGDEGLAQAMRILLTYQSGNAHPVRGWSHEPKRA